MQRYPTTIQLPITHLCNFDCVMCGMRHMVNRQDFSAEELSIILQDKLFSQVRYIGVNGGEPFLKPDITQCIMAMIHECQKLREINIISNGFYTTKIMDCLSSIRAICDERKISVNIAISLDGIGDMQDFHRGKEGAYQKATETIRQLVEHKLADSIQCICTITKYNIYRINEVEEWSKYRLK